MTLMTAPSPIATPLWSGCTTCSRLTRWRSTRNWRSTSLKLPISRKSGRLSVTVWPSASRRSFSTSACEALVARVANGNLSRLRARRIRLDITMSDTGPTPRSHSLGCLISASNASDMSPCLGFVPGLLLLLQAADLVAQPGRLLELLVVDGLLQLPLEVQELGL